MVHVKNLTHRFGPNTILEDISLDVSQGEILAIMGSSGGGKTTLLRCVSGLIVATEGEILVDDVDVRANPEEARRRMGMVFQSAALFDFMTVYENVLFGVQRQLRLKKEVEREVVASALDRVGLQGSEGKMPSELSGGMRKRVGLARALALRPRVMLYDEPTTGLDPITTYTIDELMVSVCRELQVTSLVVSHDVNSVFRVADRVAFLHRGRVIFLGTPEEFKESREESIREILHKAQATKL
jgi:phospholipid/cholesterol/gamma-HCH transport system ATP-binding protein